MLPRGEYTVVVYDDEDVEVENPAYNTTITISSSSVIHPSGMCLTYNFMSDSKAYIYLNAK